MGFRYAVIGSGRQGTSAAYDLVRFGDAEYLLLADQSLAQADRAAARVNQLIGRQVAHAVQVEVQNEDAVVSMLTGAAIEVLISGVPYFYNLGLTRAALRAHASMCDFGGNTDTCSSWRARYGHHSHYCVSLTAINGRQKRHNLAAPRNFHAHTARIKPLP